MRNKIAIVYAITLVSFIFLLRNMFKDKENLKNSEAYIVILQDSLDIKEEEITRLRTRERELVEKGGTLQQEYSEYKFRMEKSIPVVLTHKPTNTNPNEKVVPISVTASEHYIELLTARYKK